jgi:hypothetical protein
VHGDQLWIVLGSQRHEGVEPAALVALPGRMIRLPWATDPRVAFREGWRNICRAG